MDDFYFYACVISLLILIVLLTMIGITISKGNTLKVYPPTQKQCPDYWVEGTNTNLGYCKYPGKAATNPGNTAFAGDFNYVPGDTNKTELDMLGTRIYTDDPPVTSNASATGSSIKNYYIKFTNDASWNTIYSNAYAGLTPRCAKRKWANDNGIVWDGITNFNGC